MNKTIIHNICKKVYKQIGKGCSEFSYKRALLYELLSMNVAATDEYYFNQLYTDSKSREHIVSTMRIDIVVFDWNLGIECKTVQKLSKKDYLQARKYKELSNGMDIMLVNFGFDKLEVELI